MHRAAQKTLILFFLTMLLIVSLQSTLAATRLENEFYSVSPYPIENRIRIETFELVDLKITNKATQPIALDFTPSLNFSQYILISPKSTIIDGQSMGIINVTLLGDTLGEVNGTIIVQGTHAFMIPVYLKLTEHANTPIQSIGVDLKGVSEKAIIGKPYTFETEFVNLISTSILNFTVYTTVTSLSEGNASDSILLYEEDIRLLLNSTQTRLTTMYLNDTLPPGDYAINVTILMDDESASITEVFHARFSFFAYRLFGLIRVSTLLIILGSLLTIAGFVYYLHLRRMKLRRYKATVDYSQMPKPGPRIVRLGKFAETEIPMYFELEQLKTHTLIAGSTGGGKTVSAEVIIEEALAAGTAVIVFDPTAQWSGFLRKNTNKKMFSIYQFFKMKKTDARAFNGNVRALEDPREFIDVRKYMKPGEITVFTLTKLDPSDVDIVVANTIKGIFNANFEEHPLLRLMVVFDEVHRLLPKFGGSGAGFTQIERGAREFRKWGIGIMMISQVLSDFAGEIKANISTEIQMRTRDQGDLDRIKTKYGDYMLQSLVKSATGVGMMQNSAYNRGNPFFVWFRPLLHEHARLTNEELDNYNKYNELIDEYDYQIQQLEELKIDVFDYKLELKMALDKVKAGNFNMVNIYLDGLKPRLDEQWKKLGKTPKKHERVLVSEEDIQKELTKAREERAKFEAQQGEGKEKKAAPKALKFPPLKLQNGQEARSPIQLVDILTEMSDEDFKKEVGGKKNTIAQWIGSVHKGWGKQIKEAGTDKNYVIDVLNTGAPPEEEKKDEKKE